MPGMTLVDINVESGDVSKQSFAETLGKRRALHEIERKKAISRLEPDKNPVKYLKVQSVLLPGEGGRNKKIVQKQAILYGIDCL